MAVKTDFDKVKKDIKKLVADIAEMPAKDIKDGDSFYDDLGIDSMKALEIVASIEKKYKVPIPENKIPTMRSLQSVYAFLEKKLK